jgi:O-antigen ligase
MLTDSRAAAIVTVGLTVCGAFLLSAGFTDESRLFRGGLSIMAVAALGLGLNIGWETLTKRMQTIEVDYHMREQMYITARAIAKDYPYFGTGPGTFDPVFQMYRSSPDEYWPAHLHNDWLETRITFGGIGFGAILLALLLAAFRWFLPGGIQSSWSFPAFCWLSLAGCLLHARFDFPFQIYSIVFLFVLLCAILSTLSRRPQGQAP